MESKAKPGKRVALISKFKFSSILSKTVIALLLLIVLIVGSFYTLINTTVTQRLQTASQSTEQLRLTKISTVMDAALAEQSRQMDEFLNGPDMLTLMAQPEQLSQESLDHILASAADLEGRGTVASRAYFYNEKNELFYLSDGTVLHREEMPDAVLLSACFSGTGDQLTFDGVDTELKRAGIRIFLIQHVSGQMPQGLLVVEIDQEKFLQRLSELLVADEQIFAYTSEGQPLFATLVQYPRVRIPQVEPGQLVTQSWGENTLYCHVSEKSGLCFLSVVADADIVPTLDALLVSSLPYLIVLLIITAVLALYLIFTIYRPIQDVLYAMVSGDQPEPAPEAGGNEFDFIKRAYTFSEDKNTRLTQLLAEVAPAVTDQLFHTLMAGDAAENEHIQATLESIGSPFQMEDRYVVLLINLTGDNQAVGGLEAGLNMQWLIHFGTTYWNSRTSAHFMKCSAVQCAGILSFPASMSVAQIKFALSTFEEMLRKQEEARPCIEEIAAGQVHAGITEVRTSFLEASEALNRRRYYHHAEEETESTIARPSGNSGYYVGRTRQILALALEGRGEEAALGISMVYELAQQGAQPADSLFQVIHSTAVDELVKNHLDIDSYGYEQVMGTAGTPEQRAKAMAEFLEAAISQLVGIAERNQNRHIESAKKYIADHYADSLLSLQDVSQHVGISRYYLSRLFSDQLGQGFVDYLSQYRIEKAKQLLTATDLSVAEVGYRVGFNSSQNFNRVFKKYVGSTPRQFSVAMTKGE